jgi:predicted negative regulator of RcsB-dependent stress response
MSSDSKWCFVTIALVVCGAYLYVSYAETKLSDAQAQTTKAEEAMKSLQSQDQEKAWERVEHAADALLDDDPSRRKEALKSFRTEMQRFRSRFGYKQLSVGK